MQSGQVGHEVAQRDVARVGGEKIIDGPGEGVEAPGPAARHALDLEHMSTLRRGCDKTAEPGTRAVDYFFLRFLPRPDSFTFIRFAAFWIRFQARSRAFLLAPLT